MTDSVVEARLSRRALLQVGGALAAGATALTVVRPNGSVHAAAADDPSDLTVLELLPLLQSRQLSARELVESCIRRTDILEPQVRAFITRTDELALQQADAVDRDRAAGRSVGVLAGIPVGLKDLYYTKGIRTTANAGALADFVPDFDATVWERLRAAGAVLLGKLNTHEFAYGTSTPPTGNPWDLTRTPGGSSGGSAAALAARMLPLATGSDTIGSLRLPASVCGLPSLRPTYGRTSRHGVVALAWSLDTTGVMARRLGDIALGTGVVAGYDPLDPSTLAAEVPAYPTAATGSLEGVRLGVARGSSFFSGLDAGVAAVIEGGLSTLRSLGAELVDVVLPAENATWDGAPLQVLLAEASTYHEQLITQRPTGYSTQVRALVSAGRALPATVYLDAQRQRSQSARGWTHLFAEQRLDAVVWPTVKEPPGQRGTDNENPGEGVGGGNITTWCTNGFPSITMPAGLDPSGLPVGLLFGGPPLTEPRLFQIGLAYEAALEFWRQRPKAVTA